MIWLNDGDKYRNRKTGKVFTLNLDYNLLWYLDRRYLGGYIKILSVNIPEMVKVLEEHYEKVE
ncbi:hypothetical protein [Bacillus thuringiensis]|uniref:hypothetical protein n=1 Tax=Bacillus thuringiensis TaxID=1428 RepID=UPI000BF89DBB|nr:hypothetical protein [Bacillus thuringiensis]PES54427.1 hypothetical protein CN506_20340 [Bacillus thuringiensis]